MPSLEIAVAAANLICVTLVAVLVVVCLTSEIESLVTVELSPETTAGLISVATAVLTKGFTNAALTVVTTVAISAVLV